MGSSILDAFSMDSNIWARLPDHVLDGILARLPVQSLLRFRSVCKRWKALVDSATFLDFHCQVYSSTPWLLMFKMLDRKLCRAYDSFSNRWRTMCFGFLPSRVREVATACGGLLCFRVGVSGSLVVCNPITQTWKELPPMLKGHTESPIAMVLEPESKSFKVIVAGCDTKRRSIKTAVYDSRTNCWKRGSDLPIRTELRYETPFCDGVLYFTTSDPIVVLAYSLKQEAWTKLKAPLPESLTCARLVVIKNSVFLVAGLGSNGISRILCLWELQQDIMQWMEVQRVPEMMCKEFLASCYHTYDHISCIGHEDHIYLFCRTSPEVLVYKISRKTWHWLPQCPLLPQKTNGRFKWFSYEPSLLNLP